MQMQPQVLRLAALAQDDNFYSVSFAWTTISTLSALLDCGSQKSSGSHGGCLCFDAGLDVYAGEGWPSPKPGLRPPSGLRIFWVSPPLPGSTPERADLAD